MLITIYGMDGCKYCTEAEELLDDLDIPYEYINTSNSSENIKDVLRNEYADEEGRVYMPVILIDGEHLGGIIELRERFSSL